MENKPNVIESAVAPLKADATARAEKDARAYIARIAERLAEKGNDLEVYAPYPKGTLPRPEYMKRLNHRKLVESLVSHDAASRKMHEPDYVQISAAKADRFVELAILNAGFQYDAFVAKLVGKLGKVETAQLSGNHVWSYSVLSITRFDGCIEHWQTRQIVNVSKLGTLFNQWPTRRVKH